MIRRLTGVLLAATAVLAVSAGTASAAPARDAELQQRVDRVLADIPGGTQVSANEVRYDGLTVTLDAVGKATPAISCGYGHLCFRVGGQNFDFYTCKTWSLSNWLGNAPYNNNQTTNTVARAYDNNGNERWASRAPDQGTVNVNPWYYLRPC